MILHTCTYVAAEVASPASVCGHELLIVLLEWDSFDCINVCEYIY